MRACGLLLCAFIFSYQPALRLDARRDTPPNAQSFVAQEQTRDGVTIKLMDAGWYRHVDLATPSHHPAGIDIGTVFAASLLATTKEPIEISKGVFYRGDLRRQLTCALVTDHARYRCGFSVPGRPDLAEATYTGRPDPNSSLVFEVEYRDPRFSEQKAEGWIEDYLDLSGLPAVHVEGESRDIQITRTTRQGERITLTRVGLMRSPFYGHELRYFIEGHGAPPDDKPDLKVWFYPRLPSSVRSEVKNVAEDDLGHSLTTDGMSDFVRAGDILHPADYAPGRFTFLLLPPSPGAHTVNLHLTTSSWSQAFRIEKAYRHFRFVVPVRDIRPLSGTPRSSEGAIAVQPLGETGGTVVLETLGPGRQQGGVGDWMGRLLVRSPAPESEARRWSCTRFEWRKPGETYPGGRGFLEDGNATGGRLLARRDGTPLAPNESEWQMQLGFGDTVQRRPPETFSLYSEWTEMEADSFALDFRSLPIPKVGKIAKTERGVRVGRFGTFVVTKVGRYDADHPLSPSVAADIRKEIPAAGLVAVIEYRTGPETPKPVWDISPLWNRWTFREWHAEDEKGRWLVRKDYFSSQHPIRDELDPKPGRHAMSVYLLRPPPESKTFRLQMKAERTVPLRHATVVFDDLSAAKLVHN